MERECVLWREKERDIKLKREIEREREMERE
jgi:hypothetical protein